MGFGVEHEIMRIIVFLERLFNSNQDSNFSFELAATK